MPDSISRRRFLQLSVAPLAAPLLTLSAPEQPFHILMNPFVQDAEWRRSERQEIDRGFRHAVDLQLNANRYNFVLYGYGDTHEPPHSERVEIGSFTILSYDRARKRFTKTSLTHDIWAPEIFRYLRENEIPHDGSPIKIHRAYHDGGFDLMRQVIEHATGLCADFCIALRDEAIARAIDNVLEYITVDVPYDLQVLPFYLNGEKRGLGYPDNFFRKGRQRFDGARAIQYIKTIPVETPGSYNKQLEHRVREGHVFKALRASVRDNLRNPLFLPRLLLFWQQEESQGTAHADFDVKELLAGNLSLVGSAVESVLRNGLGSIQMPDIEREIYIVDANSGDGGVQWASVNGALFNPIIRRLIATGRIPNGGRDLEVPLSDTSNPHAWDLVREYWGPVRRRVKELLLRA